MGERKGPEGRGGDREEGGRREGKQGYRRSRGGCFWRC